MQCMRKLCGAAVQSFATGPDGGRNASFHGTAEGFPSSAKPYEGKTIGQANQTNGINAHFSDPSFGGAADAAVTFASNNSIVDGKAVRIRRVTGLLRRGSAGRDAPRNQLILGASAIR